MPFYRMFLDSVKRIEKNRFCNSNFNKLLQSIYHRKKINYKIIVRGVQFRIVYLLWGKHRIDIAYWYLFLTVTIYEFFYWANTILFESWCIISHISGASLLDLLYFFIGFCLANIDEIFESHNNVSSDSGFVRGPASKKYVRVSNKTI